MRHVHDPTGKPGCTALAACAERGTYFAGTPRTSATADPTEYVGDSTHSQQGLSVAELDVA
jgi:hypothetical protein